MTQPVWSLLNLVAAGAIACTLGGFIARLDWRLEILSHFRIQYFFLLAISSLVFLTGGKYTMALFSGVFSAINLLLIFPFYFKPTIQPPKSEVYRLLLANVRQKNTAYDQVRQLILSSQADFVILVEINQKWVNALRPVLDTYPACLTGPREDEYGVAILSRRPFHSTEMRTPKGEDLPILLAGVELEGREVLLMTTHPPPPKSRRMAERRNVYLQEIARLVSSLQGAVIFAADLNATSWSPHFLDLVRHSRLYDSRQGFGVQPTWPVGNFIFRIPIDHALVSAQIHITQRRVGTNIGSDHFPVILDFSLESEERGYPGL